MDCGSQQTFTCSVTGQAAGWTISPEGIGITTQSGLTAADNPWIYTADTNGTTQSSTITVTGFITADNGGTVQCIDLDDEHTQGMATILISK